MTDTFNPVEIAEDKDLTIANLRAQLMQLRLDCQELQREAAEARSQAPSVDQVISKYVTDLVSSILEGNDIRSLIEQCIDQQVERMLEQPDFVLNHVEEAVKGCIDGFEIDCEDQVERAIEEALEKVDIRFGGRR